MEANQPLWKRPELAFVLFSSAFLYLHLFVFPAVPIFYEEDHLIFVNDAWRMMQGQAIYRDFFQFTFPGTQVLYLVLFNVFGTKFWLINTVIFAQGLAQVLICLAISKRVLGNGWHAYLPSCLFLFFGFRWLGIDGSHRMLSPVFIWLAVLVLLRSRTITRICLAGSFCAVASYFTQQRGLLALFAIAIFLLIEAIKDKGKLKNFLLSEVVLFGSFGGILFILILPFLISAGVGTFFESTVLFIRYYVEDSTTTYGIYVIALKKVLGQGILISLISIVYYSLIPWVYLVAFIYLWRKGYRSDILLIAITGFILAAGTFGPNPGRIFQVSIPGLIIFVWLLTGTKLRSVLFARVAVITLMVFGGITAIRVQTNWDKFYLDAPTGRIAFLSPVTIERYAWLEANTSDHEYVFEVYQSAVNFPLLLPSPVQVPFLLNSDYTPKQQITQSIENLEIRKPRFIIWDRKWSKEISDRNTGENLAPLYEYLRQKYEPVKLFTTYGEREMELWKRVN